MLGVTMRYRKAGRATKAEGIVFGPHILNSCGAARKNPRSGEDRGLNFRDAIEGDGGVAPRSDFEHLTTGSIVHQEGRTTIFPNWGYSCLGYKSWVCCFSTASAVPSE